MSVQKVATRYAKSLIDLAQEKGKLDRILEDVKSFSKVAENRDFALLLKSPVIKADTKWKVFEKLFKNNYDDLTLSFLSILLKKNREGNMVDIANEFIAQYKKIRHITTVKLTTAARLGEATIKSIHEKLEASPATEDNVELITKVNPNLIGGFVIEFDDNLYDASVAHKLNVLKKEFKDNLYISQIIA